MKNQDENEMIKQIYAYTVELKKSGKSDAQIRQALIERGLDEESAQSIVDSMNKAIAEKSTSGGAKIPSAVIWILLLIGVNILSAVFGWPFWIY